MDQLNTSETQFEEQEADLEMDDLQGAPSETQTAAQERRAGQPISEEERLRRLEQSLSDRLTHRLSMLVESKLQEIAAQREEMERLQREQEDLERQIEELDDEDYGALAKERDRKRLEAQKAQAQLQQQLTQALLRIQQDAIETIPDEALRKEMEQRVSKGEFKTPKDFLKAVGEAVAKAQLKAELPKKEQEIERAAQNEAIASMFQPQLGRGLPPNSKDNFIPFGRVPSHELISQGLAEALARKRKQS